MRVLSTELPTHVGERVTLAGWVHATRDLGAVSFLVPRDRAGLAQVVGSELLELQPETVVEVEGEAVAAAQAPGGVELREPSFRVLSEAAHPLPIELPRPGLKETLPTVLDFAPLALRHPRERAKFELAAASLAGFRGALDRLGFMEISTPKIVASATESGANVFAVDMEGAHASQFRRRSRREEQRTRETNGTVWPARGLRFRRRSSPRRYSGSSGPYGLLEVVPPSSGSLCSTRAVSSSNPASLATTASRRSSRPAVSRLSDSKRKTVSARNDVTA